MFPNDFGKPGSMPLRSAKVAQSDANRLAAEPIIVSVPPRVEANASGILGLVQAMTVFERF